ncbi:MAG: hypothetical protein Ct9H300mP24_8780 [Candidatus Neomarinimicrobiota bacterium]|nr:MAG: hypothetical protein Ct9H300mP24_8780 [Candidatus Neomarinimicrobiota bacterium]
MDNDFILNTCKENFIDFVIVGPEAPLTNGVLTYFKMKTSMFLDLIPRQLNSKAKKSL